MTINRFETPVDEQVFLSEREISEVREQVVFPAVNFLARRNFTHQAPEDSVFASGETIPHEWGRERIEIGAVIETSHFCLEFSGERVCSATIKVAQLVPELVSALLKTAQAEDYLEDIEEDEEDDETYLNGWEQVQYTFSTIDGYVTKKQVVHILEDHEGDTVWSSAWVDIDDESDEEAQMFAELEGAATGFTNADAVLIKNALAKLGVSA